MFICHMNLAISILPFWNSKIAAAAGIILLCEKFIKKKKKSMLLISLLLGHISYSKYAVFCIPDVCFAEYLHVISSATVLKK